MEKSEYYITDGTKFVKQGINNQYKTVTNLSIADSWNNSQVAKAVLNNSIPKAWRKTYYVAKYEDGSFIKLFATQEEKDEIAKEVKCNTERKSYNLDLYSFEKDMAIQFIIDGFENVKHILKEAEEMQSKLQKELLTLEYMFEDVKHYRLRKKLGTVNSYKLKKMGDEIIIQRMSVKNQLEILYKINSYRQSIESPIKDICGTINAIRNKKYIPRVLVDLFENDNLDIEVKAQ